MLIRRYIEPEPVLKLDASALLVATQSVKVYDPEKLGLYAIPGNDIVYTLNVKNTGYASTNIDSIELMDSFPDEVEFYNGDIDDVGSETNPISFSQSASAGLTFTYSSDVRFSNSVTKPANFLACLYTPISGYDPNVNFICINPKGALASGSPDPEFSIDFRVRIK